jgi:hypothetical protein
VVHAPPVAGGRAHLLFLRDTALMAQPFDVATPEAVGDPFPVGVCDEAVAEPDLARFVIVLGVRDVRLGD